MAWTQKRILAAMQGAEQAYNERMALILANLPLFPKTGHRCSGDGYAELQWVEELTGWYDAEPSETRPGSIAASTNGWDDISEDGRNGYLTCTGCHKVWRVDDIIWNGG
jgi:hypothetical protein